MDQGLAAIIAAVISTLAGGVIGFTSAYFTTRQSQKHSRVAASLPKQAESIEFISLTIFKALSGEQQSSETWDRFITSSLWLPQKERIVCLSLLQNREDTAYLRSAQKEVLTLFDKMIKGE